MVMPTDPVFIVIKAKGNALTDKVTTRQFIATGADITRTSRLQVTTQPHRLYLPVIAR